MTCCLLRTAGFGLGTEEAGNCGWLCVASNPACEGRLPLYVDAFACDREEVDRGRVAGHHEYVATASARRAHDEIVGLVCESLLLANGDECKGACLLLGEATQGMSTSAGMPKMFEAFGGGSCVNMLGMPEPSILGVLGAEFATNSWATGLAAFALLSRAANGCRRARWPHSTHRA